MLNQIRRLLLLSGILFSVVGCEGLTIETIQGPVGDTAGSGDTGGSETDTGGDTALDTGAEDTAVDTATDTATDTEADTAADTEADTAADTAVDTATDTATDTEADTAADTAVDTAADTEVDTATDTEVDTAEDTATDTAEDTATDTEVDAGAVCGNGSVEAGEGCDDGNVVTEACIYGEASCEVCNATCQLEPGAVTFCGDGFPHPTELCDEGTGNGVGVCSLLCVCSEGFHLDPELYLCVSDERSCSIPNGSGRQVWTGTEFGTCEVLNCNDGYRQLGTICVRAICGDSFTDSPSEQCDDGNTVTEVCSYGLSSCSVCNAVCQRVAGTVTYCGNGLVEGTEVCDDGDGSDTNGCTTGCVCSSAYHLESGLCTSDTRSCSLSNAATATESWNSGTSSYGSCIATACASTYHLESGACVSDTRSCSIANGTGSQNYTSGSWGTCGIVSCNSTYHAESGACVSDTRSCSIANGTGSQTWSGGAYGSCTPESCNTGYRPFGSICIRTICGDAVVDPAEQCDDGNAVTEVCAYGLNSCEVCNATCQLEPGAATYCGNGLVDGAELCDDGDGSDTNGCTTGCVCSSAFHLEAGACTSDTRSCSSANATVATQTWNSGTSSYGSCTATACSASYHIESGACVSDTRSCSIANGTGSQSYVAGSWGICGVLSCNSAFHLESGACTSDTRSCSASNATAATQTWTGSTYGACTANACSASYHVESGACVSNTRNCTSANATSATESWTGSGYGTCTATACASSYHVESGACVSDTRSCSIANGTGSQAYAAGSWGTCGIVSCNSTYHAESGACVSDTRSCIAANATAATESWTGTGYGVCTISACSAGYALVANSCVGGCGNGVIGSGETCDDGNAVTEQCAYGDVSCTVCNATCQTAAGETDFCTDGVLDPTEFCDDGNTSNADACNNSCTCGTAYHAQGGVCASNVQACAISFGSGSETWNGSFYGVCTLTSCDSGYHAAGNACVSDTRSCTLANATAATQTWNSGTSSYGTCTATACTASYHIESGACVSDTRSCAIANGTGSQTYASGSWGTCSVVSCNSTYHIESGACASNTRSCSLANATAASQTWTGSAYGSCTASACASGYTVSAGACVVSGYALGTACTGNAQCASGFCGTGPTGTANDRCAPTGMSYVAAGSFNMGSPSGETGRGPDEQQHNVTITRSFFIGETEVTQGQWKALAGALNNPSSFSACGDNCPVEKVDWFAAALYANAKSASEGLTSCYTLSGCSDPTNGWKLGDPFGCADASFAGLSCTGYRLPTEAEWEFAARASTTTSYYWGASSDPAYYWFAANAGSQTNVAKSKLPNALGLYDMSGNVSEWVNDRYDGNYVNALVVDPLGGTSAGTGLRSVRGGSYLGAAAAARSAARLGTYSPPESYNSLGFRLARTAP